MPNAPHPQSLAEAIELFVRGDYAQAEPLFLQVIRESPDHAAAHQFLGRISLAAGRLPQAAAYMTRAAQLDPTNPGWFRQLGEVHARLGDKQKAAALYQQAIALDPGHTPAAVALAYLFFESGQMREAEAVLQQSFAADPENPELLACRGVIASRRGDLEAALACFQQAAEKAPGEAKFHACLGNCFKDLGRLPQAIAAYEAALRLAPNVPMGHLNYAIALLLHGELARGWKEFEARPPALAAAKSTYPRPFWKGERVISLMLWAEQGFGDVIQFARYVPLLTRHGVRVCLGVQPELIELLEPLAGPGNVFSAKGQVPMCDAQQLLMSLPIIFGTHLGNIPAAVPYLQTDEFRPRKFAQLMDNDRGRLKIGLAWSGRPTHTNDANRSIDPALFAPLAAIPGIAFYSLQLGALTRPPQDFPLRDLTPLIANFADSAALISNLDMVISVDTSVVHLAGALAKPVWTLLPFIPDWRWMLERRDSPWYPTMRLYRQSAYRDWSAPLQQIQTDLLIQLGRSPATGAAP